MKTGNGLQESPETSGIAPRHKAVATRKKRKTALIKPMELQDKTTKFKKDLSRFLSGLAKINPDDTTIPEFRRWSKEDLMSFEEKSPDEQINEKLNYEISIGNDSKVFSDIDTFLDIWVEENVEKKRDDHIWYHGTTEEKYRKIMAEGEIKVSTVETIQHKGFAHDIGTISLAKYKSMAHFFSAISGMGKQSQIILHIDTSILDTTAMKKRTLITSPEAELIYRKNIPVSAIIKVEMVYVTDEKNPAIMSI